MIVRFHPLRRRAGVILLVAACLLAAQIVAALIAPTPAAAQTDLDLLRRQVLDWLLKELNKPSLILTEYTYLGTSWPDSSLGCPVEGQSYTPGTYHGYEWSFQFDNQVRYIVHSDLTGAIKVLCSALNVGPEVRLVRFRAQEFEVLVPESWLDYPSADGRSVLFASQNSEDCTLPGMRVTILGQVASSATPDSLITEALQAAGQTDAPANRVPVGSFGRVTRVEATCNGLAQRRYVAAFVEYGRAYRVEQWALVDDLPTWDQPLANMLAQFAGAGTLPAPAASGSATNTQPGTASTLSLPPLPLAHLFSDDVFVGVLNDLPGRSVTNLPLQDNRYLTFSPDGLHLAYINVTAAQLRGFHAFEGKSAKRLAEGIDPTFPPAWRPDGQWVAFAAAIEDADPAVRTLEIRAVPAEGGQAEVLATFTYAENCPVEQRLFDPADTLLAREGAVSEAPNTLVWLAEDRFLVSSGCAGGLSYLDPAANRVIELGADLRGGALAPDGQRFAARGAEGIAVLDFGAWQRSDLKLGAGAGALAWSPDGSALYYAAATLIDTVEADDPALAEAGAAQLGGWPVAAGVYDVHLRRIDLASAAATDLWQGTGRGIGRIMPAPDGSGLLFSHVPAAGDWVQAVVGQYEPFALTMSRPTPALYWLPTGSPIAHLLAYSGQPTFAPISPASAG